MKTVRIFAAIATLLAVWVLTGCGESSRGPVSLTMNDTGTVDKGSPYAEAEKEAKLHPAKASEKRALKVHPRHAGGKPGYMW